MINWIQQNGMTALAFTGFLVSGVFVTLGYLGMGTRDRRKESEGLADTLISRLKETVDQQTDTIASLSSKLDVTTKELHQMQGRNSVLEGLFNGSETSIIASLKLVPELLRVANESNQLAKDTSNSVGQMAKALGDLLQRIDIADPHPAPQLTIGK